MDTQTTGNVDEAKAEFKEMSSEQKQNVADMANIDFKEEGNQLVQYLCDIAKRFCGYKYISLSRFNGFPKDNKLSTVGETLRLSYVLTQGGDNAKFAEAFGKGNIGLIQAHTELPPLHEDGFYDCTDVNGKMCKTKRIEMVKILDPDHFAPCIVIKQPNGFGYLEGNPYHTVTSAEARKAAELLLGKESKA